MERRSKLRNDRPSTRNMKTKKKERATTLPLKKKKAVEIAYLDSSLKDADDDDED